MGGTEVNIDGQDLLIMTESDILAVLSLPGEPGTGSGGPWD
jgi:hypothetical protein